MTDTLWAYKFDTTEDCCNDPKCMNPPFRGIEWLFSQSEKPLTEDELSIKIEGQLLEVRQASDIEQVAYDSGFGAGVKWHHERHKEKIWGTK